MPTAAARIAVPSLSALVGEWAERFKKDAARAKGASDLRELLAEVERLPAAHGRAVSATDSLAQAAVAWRLARLATQRLGSAHAALWEQVTAGDPFLDCLQSVTDGDGDAADWSVLETLLPPDGDPRERLVHGYERFLAGHDGATRKGRGVYYTARPIVDFIVRSVDETLRRELRLKDGLASTETCDGQPLVRILDPATGTGTFLVAVIETIHTTLANRLSGEAWQTYVTSHLLPRLAGIEILPAAYVLAHANLAIALADTGFVADEPLRLPIELSCALSSPRLAEPPFTVILGNPPYAGNSATAAPWIAELLRGKSPEGKACTSYYHLDGQPLGEKKLWLADDYVKFLRLAQWHIERAGQGIVALVTNHGYLDNATHRGLRAALRETFPQIAVLDLHGNAKKREQAPAGMVDRNVFAIESGVAIGLFAKPREESLPSIRHGDLWGTREQKLQTLAERTIDELATRPIEPTAPHFVWNATPSAAGRHVLRDAKLWRLCDAMPVWTTAPVTARDAFVVAFTREELVARLNEFRDLSIDDATIRARWFTSTRSPRYAPGDTRGWKLSDARRALAADPNWERDLIPCLYRPFDVRWIAYRPDLVDWPRAEVMRHMLAGNNLALIARRQSPASEPANYFWIADRLTLDGVIRSDNRGTEAVFPLWLVGDGGDTNSRRATSRRTLSMPCSARANFLGTLSRRFTTSMAAFSRQRTANNSPSKFAAITRRSSCRAGRKCLLRSQSSGKRLALSHSQCMNGDVQLEACRMDALPTWSQGCVRVGQTVLLHDVPEDAWNYRVHAHQVLRKWVKDRRGRILTREELSRYAGIAAAIAETIAVEQELEAVAKVDGLPSTQY